MFASDTGDLDLQKEGNERMNEPELLDLFHWDRTGS